ncbi:hypothetical protein EVAR_84556_1 [Eumeta japonica]|uniref:Uncharacterized protein n=1 Tax=Eumeta variegata TaxID=151549 RepID=A0A4C1UJ67_EUMVA|nr:hypothetical protein EVAR_84556_1 [Eumeta japonica]
MPTDGTKNYVNIFTKDFKRGCVNLSKELHDGRPSTVVINRNINAVRRMIETDRHVTYHEILATLGIGMSQIRSYTNIWV